MVPADGSTLISYANVDVVSSLESSFSTSEIGATTSGTSSDSGTTNGSTTNGSTMNGSTTNGSTSDSSKTEPAQSEAARLGPVGLRQARGRSHGRVRVWPKRWVGAATDRDRACPAGGRQQPAV